MFRIYCGACAHHLVRSPPPSTAWMALIPNRSFGG